MVLAAVGCGGSQPDAGGGDAGVDAEAYAAKGGTRALAGRVAAAGGRGGSAAASGGAGGKPAAVGGGGASAQPQLFGAPFSGGEFHLGPVDWDETQWHNACAPSTKYAPSIRALEGELLAGLWSGIPDVASACDACIAVTTDKGKTATLRVVTYGDTTPNSIDVSPQAYALLNSGEYPRNMHWQFASCPNSDDIVYEFQSGANEWWTSFWVRNARLPLKQVEVQAANHAYAVMERGSDGTLTDGGGFGKGRFSVRLTSLDGQVIVHTFDWPSSGIANAVLHGANF